MCKNFYSFSEGRFGAGYTVTTRTKGPVFIIESFNQMMNTYPGAPPPYPYQQPPMYGPPPPPPPPPAPVRGHSQFRGGRPSNVYSTPLNQSYQGLPPLQPMEPYPEYPNYPYY